MLSSKNVPGAVDLGHVWPVGLEAEVLWYESAVWMRLVRATAVSLSNYTTDAPPMRFDASWSASEVWSASTTSTSFRSPVQSDIRGVAAIL